MAQVKLYTNKILNCQWCKLNHHCHFCWCSEKESAFKALNHTQLKSPLIRAVGEECSKIRLFQQSSEPKKMSLFLHGFPLMRLLTLRRPGWNGWRLVVVLVNPLIKKKPKAKNGGSL